MTAPLSQRTHPGLFASCLAFTLLGSPTGVSQSFLPETLFLDRFEDGFFTTNPDPGGGWDTPQPLSIGTPPSQEVQGAFQILPGGPFDFDGSVYAPERPAASTIPVQDPANTFVFECVITDPAVTRTRVAAGDDFRVGFGISSTDVNRFFESQHLFHTDDGGVMLTLFLDSDLAGTTTVAANLVSADETNVRNNAANHRHDPPPASHL